VTLDCGHEAQQDDRVWLLEDDSVLCDCCHADAQHEDPMDRFDHGTAYSAGYIDGIINRRKRAA
jgi:hypothetical protein